MKIVKVGQVQIMKAYNHLIYCEITYSENLREKNTRFRIKKSHECVFH
jgi:hypothetical protein